MSDSLTTRFLRRICINQATGCWEWLGAVDSDGYAYQIGGKWGAHRQAYELFVGPIPDAMTVDHKCWVTKCVNPDHLQLLSNRDNAGRQRRALATHCQRGHEFTPENTELRTDRGRRKCRACTAMRRARARAG